MIHGRSIAAALFLFVAACPNPPADDSEVARDANEYMAALREWEPHEREVFQALSEVRRSHFADEEFAIRRLRGAAPAAAEHNRKVALYRPKTAEIRRIHEAFEAAWIDLERSLGPVIAALEERDSLALAQAKDAMYDSRDRVIQAIAAFDDVLQAYREEIEKLREQAPAAA